MRLFTTMLVALLSILGGCNLKAQVTVSRESESTPVSEITTGYYVIKAKYKSDNERWACMNGTSTKFTTDEPTTPSCVWYIEQKDDKTFYIKNAGTSTYIKLANNLSPEATNADTGGNLTSTTNKSDATYFCANADFQLNASSSKIDNNSFTIYAGAKASSVTRQHIHANNIGNNTSMTMSSWSTTIGSENVGASTVGQFVFYKANISETLTDQSRVALSTNCIYYMKASNGLYFTTDCKFSTSKDNAIKVYVNKRSDGYFDLHLSPNAQKLTCSASRAWTVADTRVSSRIAQDQWQVLEVEGINQYYIRNMELGYITTGTDGNLVSFSSSSPILMSFIPANESATAARDLKLDIKSGDAVHGNLATFSASYPVSVPENCTAYTATHDATNNVINITELTGNVIPANTGVMIKSETTGEVAMKPTLEAGTAVTDNKLVSVGDADKTFSDNEKSANNIYLLGKQNETFCFCLMNNEGDQTIKAHKAYIQLDNADQAASLQINFGGEVTDINNARFNETNTKNNAYYDLSGRRVMRPQHGLYIVNGKKVIIK